MSSQTMQQSSFVTVPNPQSCDTVEQAARSLLEEAKQREASLSSRSSSRLLAEAMAARAAGAALHDVKRRKTVATPSTATPRAKTPRATTPRSSTPRATTPRATTPRSTLPHRSAPRASTPCATTPRAITPRATTPGATTPSAAEARRLRKVSSDAALSHTSRRSRTSSKGSFAGILVEAFEFTDVDGNAVLLQRHGNMMAIIVNGQQSAVGYAAFDGVNGLLFLRAARGSSPLMRIGVPMTLRERTQKFLEKRVSLAGSSRSLATTRCGSSASMMDGERQSMSSSSLLPSCRTSSIFQPRLSDLAVARCEDMEAGRFGSSSEDIPVAVADEQTRDRDNEVSFSFVDADGDEIELVAAAAGVKCYVKGALWASGLPDFDPEALLLRLQKAVGKHPHLRVHVPTHLRLQLSSFLALAGSEGSRLQQQQGIRDRVAASLADKVGELPAERLRPASMMSSPSQREVSTTSVNNPPESYVRTARRTLGLRRSVLYAVFGSRCEPCFAPFCRAMPRSRLDTAAPSSRPSA
eukprot:TRINITY_DN3887_c1_g1_i1.p1 TRINITY_DN3887_c1_g1~~TRINITY_DN3887_c1_g1_i1.p1  ORF type:complete len:525 (+),score=103.04 TRINITY_DN3887_c1_g1_i1:147-1721(+)